MNRTAYVKVDGHLRGIITLGSGERFVFVSGGNILFILFPFLQWIFPISCWRDDDLAEEIDQNSGNNRTLWETLAIGIFGGALAKLIPTDDNIRLLIHLPVFVWAILMAICVVGVIKFITRVSRRRKIYRVRIHPQKYGIIQGLRGLAVYLIFMFLVMICFSTLIKYLFPAMLLCLLAYLAEYIFLFGLMDVHDCQVEFIEKK